MPSATNKGGHISQVGNVRNEAGVDEAKATKTGAHTATWVVKLSKEPTIANFTAGQALTYNAKGTRNPNADNALVVVTVNGPTKYTCNGNWPMNI
jgi:hypothetical protein